MIKSRRPPTGPHLTVGAFKPCPGTFVPYPTKNEGEGALALNIVDHLKSLKFIGMFPQGIEVLLVSVDTAVQEAKVLDKELTSSKLKKLLEKNSIYIFNSLEDYVKFKDGLKK